MQMPDTRSQRPVPIEAPVTRGPAVTNKTPEPAVQAVREALRAILLLKKTAESDETADRLELLRRAEAALYESAWQTRRAVGREHGHRL